MHTIDFFSTGGISARIQSISLLQEASRYVYNRRHGRPGRMRCHIKSRHHEAVAAAAAAAVAVAVVVAVAVAVAAAVAVAVVVAVSVAVAVAVACDV